MHFLLAQLVKLTLVPISKLFQQENFKIIRFSAKSTKIWGKFYIYFIWYYKCLIDGKKLTETDYIDHVNSHQENKREDNYVVQLHSVILYNPSFFRQVMFKILMPFN